MEGWLNVTMSIGDDVFVPMAMTKESAGDTEENLGVADRLVGMF